MPALFRSLPRLIAPPAWGPALATVLGTALPFLLGVITTHPGFYWATLGAFAASLANPLKPLGMQGMLILALLGAFSAALGFWAGSLPWPSLAIFASYGALLGLARRYGQSLVKLMLTLAICLCLGQGQFGRGAFDNPVAIAALFLLGALGVTLLGFGLRGIHGLRMWPAWPPRQVWQRALRQQRLAADRAPGDRWELPLGQATTAGLAGLSASLLLLPQSQWLTLATFVLLSAARPPRWAWQALYASLLVLTATLLVFAGYSLVGTALMVALTLAVVTAFRLLQARRTELFMVQASLGALLLSESIAQDWSEPQWRLVNAALGVTIGLLISGLTRLLHHLVNKRRRHSPTAGTADDCESTAPVNRPSRFAVIRRKAARSRSR